MKTVFGKTLTIKDWARAAGVRAATVHWRMNHGMSLHRALSTPVRRFHGHSGTVEYRAWHHMVDRCTNTEHPQFDHYGGRGITVCEAWLTSFDAFLADVGRRPAPGLSIDRIDNDGPYAPGNVRWATAREQSENRRANTTLTFRGETKTLTAWARGAGISLPALKRRLRAGWTPERAVMTKRDDTRVAFRFRVRQVGG